VPHLSAKKRIADRVIKVYPQDQLSYATSFLSDQRFLFANLYGFIVETREADETSIFAEFRRGDDRQPLVKLLFKNKAVRYFAMNREAVCYASDSQFGIKMDKFTSWEKEWFDIQGVALSGSWMAVANTSEIRFVDLAGSLIKCVCFDRPIIAMDAYENLLAVVYHSGVPIYEAQLLAMDILTVNPCQMLSASHCHVPLTLPQPGEKGFVLKWFGFSLEGLIFSKDSAGAVRAYSLDANEWTPLHAESVADQKKSWVIGFREYCMLYWRTTET
jgi:hypothetical protein